MFILFKSHLIMHNMYIRNFFSLWWLYEGEGLNRIYKSILYIEYSKHYKICLFYLRKNLI